MDILKKLSLAGIVPVIKVEDARDAVPLCRALEKGGLPVAEITFRTAAARDAIENVKRELPDVLLGAGTVLTVDQVKQAVDAGAAYIVSPGLNPGVVAYCVEHGIPVVPGCASPSDVERAMSFGLDTVKFFPAEAMGGLKVIKAMSAPYSGVSFLPTGGIDVKNMPEYLACPAVLAVGGSWMVPADAVKAKDWGRVETLAREAVHAMLGFELAYITLASGSREKAEQDAKMLAKLFGWTTGEKCGTAFAGPRIGFSSSDRKGEIGISIGSVERAREYFRKMGRVPAEGTEEITNGKLSSFVLEGDVAGYSLRILSKK